MQSKIKYILTDIEGTTSSISFVHDILFPYFLNNIGKLSTFKEEESMKNIKLETENIVGKSLTFDNLIEQLKNWALEDKKIKPLKTAQGIVWKTAYENGEIKGHVYNDVEENLKNWNKEGIQLGVFSSGSVNAQKMLFKNSIAGDLNQYFSNNFDTSIGQKRESETYKNIAKELNLLPSEIVFLSDIKEELEAAKIIGYHTIQLLRENQKHEWEKVAKDFNEVNQLLKSIDKNIENGKI